jgi:hypothetical protein
MNLGSQELRPSHHAICRDPPSIIVHKGVCKAELLLEDYLPNKLFHQWLIVGDGDGVGVSVGLGVGVLVGVSVGVGVGVGVEVWVGVTVGVLVRFGVPVSVGAGGLVGATAEIAEESSALQARL